MSDLLNFYGDKSVDVKIEYVVESYVNLGENNVPFNAAILISNPDFEDIQYFEIDKNPELVPIDCHNTIWVKYRENNEIKYRLYANLNVNSVTLQGCNARTYNYSYTDLIKSETIKEETNQ